jgi:A/G-specific adenine glycosylase
MDSPSLSFRKRLQRALLAWFRRARRDLPWRADRDPYRIWVSEVMLQQTQVATVIPYFERFLRSFPTVAALAEAEEQEVLTVWAGLGYYRRARDLHCAARLIRARHGGEIPQDPALMGRLPGVGRYTLGAVLSQAFDQRLPILEANSQRVLCRLLALEGDPRESSLRSRLWEMAEKLLPVRRVGDFNQALMELGALVCTPARPQCRRCPLARLCRARHLGIQERIPTPPAPVATLSISEVAVIARHGQRVLLVQRPDNTRWAEFWEFPHGPLVPGEKHDMAAARMLRALVGIRVRLGAELTTLRYTVTRHRFALVCFEATYEQGSFQSSFYRTAVWANPHHLEGYPLSSPQRRLARALLQPVRQKRLF